MDVTPPANLTDRGAGTSRRGVLAAAAWSAPSVLLATSAPAFADSGADSGTMIFSAGAVANADRTAYSVSSVSTGGATTSLTISASYGDGQFAVGGDLRFPVRTNENFSTPTVQLTSGASVSTLLLQQHHARAGLSLAKYTFSFDREVKDVAFSISGIGSSEYGQQAVVLVGPGLVSTVPTGSTVARQTFVDYVHAYAGPGSDNPASVAGRCDFQFRGPVSTFTLEFFSASGLGIPSARLDGTMTVNVHQLTYTVA